jgi:hypothetical protein
MAESQEVLVRLEECEFVDSIGSPTRAFAQKGGRMLLCAPVKQVQRVLSMSGLLQNGYVFEGVEGPSRTPIPASSEAARSVIAVSPFPAQAAG